MRFDPVGEGICRLDHHLFRLKGSSDALGIPHDRDKIYKALEFETRALSKASKVRLQIDGAGSLDIQISPLGESPNRPSISVSQKRTNSLDPYLYHKTTQREFYDSEYDFYLREEGSYDVVFLNQRGELTEASRHNLFLVIDGKWYTPPVASGLLAGVMRKILLKDSALDISESVLFIKDLFRAESIYLSNSVRGLIEVQVSPHCRDRL